MKTILTKVLFSTLCVLGLSSCGSLDGPAVADPDGTRTISLNYTVRPPASIILYQGPDRHITASEPRYSQALLRILDASMNFNTTSILAQDPNIAQYFAISDNLGGQIADVGAVAGLGAVTTIPSSGWASSVAALVGHGYVVRFRAAYDFPAATELPYMYARVYVDSYLNSASRTVIGARVKYQLPFGG